MSIRKTARFAVEPERIDEALVAIGALVAHTQTEPGTVVYWSWQSIERPTEFLHVMEFVDAAAESAHRTSEAVLEFTEALYPLCSSPPGFDDWRAVSRGER